MRRRDFLKTTGLFAGGTLLGPMPTITGTFAQTMTPKKGGVLNWGHSEETQDWDIHTLGTASTLRFVENIHDSLVAIDSNFIIQPQLAESFEVSDNGLTYTFKLRKGVKFHTGDEMTSADVKYSFERVKDKDTGATQYEVFNDVEEILTPDDYTVIVKQGRVNAPFLGRISEIGAGAVIPVGSGPTQGTNPVGTGAFKYKSRLIGAEASMTGFADHWRGAPHLDEVYSREVTEPTTRLTGLRNGEFHMINDIPMDRVNEIKGDSNFQVIEWFPLSWAFLNFNHKREPFGDRRVRIALDYMIDKEALVQGALWGQGRPSSSPSFPSAGSHNPALKPRQQDFDKARQLLADAGFSDGQLKFVFKVTTNYPWHVQATEIMVEWFRQGGVSASIQQLSWSDWLSQCWVDKDFDVTMMNFFTLWEPDILYYILWHSTGGFNYRNVNDPELDAIAQQARETIDTAARDKLYHQIQQRIYDEAHDVILWYRNGTLGAQKNVGGLDKLILPNGSNMEFRHVWLDS